MLVIHNDNSVQYSGGFLPEIILLLTLCTILHWGILLIPCRGFCPYNRTSFVGIGFGSGILLDLVLFADRIIAEPKSKGLFYGTRRFAFYERWRFATI